MAAVLKPFFNQDVTGDRLITKSDSGKVFFVSSQVKAVGSMTFTAQPSDGNTVTLDGKVYTFQTTLTNVDGNVLRGGDAGASIANLFNAVIRGPGAGTAYAADTILHPNVDALAQEPLPLVLKLTAKRAGTAGNAITLATNVGGTTISAMAGGAPTPNIADRDFTINLPQDEVDGGNYEFIFQDNGRSQDVSDQDYFTSWTFASPFSIPFIVTSDTRSSNPYNSRSVLQAKGVSGEVLLGIKLGGLLNNGPGGTVVNYSPGVSIEFVSWGSVWYSTPPFGSGFYGLGDI